MYHRVVPAREVPPVDSPVRCLHFSEGAFEGQLRWLSSRVQFVSLDDLTLATEQPGSRPRVAVTFDDGYRDNLTCALPILRRLQIPATIFVCTRLLEGDTHQWWFGLWEFLQSVQEATVTLGGTRRTFRLTTRRERRAAYDPLSVAMRDASAAELHRLTTELDSWGTPGAHSGLCLTWEELATLARDPLIQVAPHGHRHLNLAFEEPGTVREDIQQSQRLLADRIGCHTLHFAYPYGARTDGVREVVRSLGFRTAVVAEPFPMPGANPFELPRHMMTEEHATPELECLLSGWNALWHRH